MIDCACYESTGSMERIPSGLKAKAVQTRAGLLKGEEINTRDLLDIGASHRVFVVLENGNFVLRCEYGLHCFERPGESCSLSGPLAEVASQAIIDRTGTAALMGAHKLAGMPLLSN